MDRGDAFDSFRIPRNAILLKVLKFVLPTLVFCGVRSVSQYLAPFGKASLRNFMGNFLVPFCSQWEGFLLSQLANLKTDSIHPFRNPD